MFNYKVTYVIRKGMPKGKERTGFNIVQAQNAKQAILKVQVLCRTSIFNFNPFRARAQRQPM